MCPSEGKPSSQRDKKETAMAASTEREMDPASPLEESTILLKRCECSVCDAFFVQETAVEAARAVAEHWNEDHYNLLKNSFPVYDEEEIGSHHIGDGVFQVRRKRYFISIFDVLAIDRDLALDEMFVEAVEYLEVCQDCREPIDDVGQYEELDTDGHRRKFLCGACSAARTVKQRKSENKQLDEWATEQ